MIHTAPPPVPTPYPTPSGHFNSTTIDMTGIKPTDAVSFTQTIQSTEDTHSDSFFYIEFKFINGICTNASLTFKFEEIVCNIPIGFRFIFLF